MNIDLSALGFTQEELQTRVIETICEQMLNDTGFDPYSEEETTIKSRFQKNLRALIEKRIDETVAAIAEAHVLPNVAKYIETLTWQKTNTYGEKTGEPTTFIEYLVKTAEGYLTEQVSFDGKSKKEDSYNFRGTQSRITYLVDKHLQYSIETAMKGALQVATSAISTGITETVKLKLEEITKNIKTTVKIN